MERPMNRLRPKLAALAALTLAAIVTVTPAPAQLTTVATLSIAPGTGTNVATVQIAAPANHVWILESATQLTNWTEVAALKLHNGSFARGIPPGATAKLLFRAVYDPVRQTILSATTNALRLPTSPFNYASPALPARFFQPPIPGQDNTPATNLTTDAGAGLGRVLFYDKRLSTNQTVSCSSCHLQANGFSDPRQFSVGFNGGLTGRNSMGLSNARWYQRAKFFWDERAATLEAQTLMPIQDSLEMGMTLQALTNRLSAEPFYTNLFTQTFGTPEVTAERISKALAQFVRSIVSAQSKYDLGVTSNFANFTAQENLGRQVFFGQVGSATCAACHGSDNFVPGANINNNGLENPYVDKGVGELTGRPQDEGLFKVPSLRNIELTAPYMHDGRFATLEQVVEFYDSGVVAHPSLSPPLRVPSGNGAASGTPLRLNLTPQQKAALVAFMKTLTDPSVATDAKFSDPFNYGN